MVQWFFYTLFFILPLVFYTKTSEVFEFNKIVTLYIFTILITTAWVVKMISQKKIIFKRTLLDIPLLLFLGSQVISTLVSIDQRTSLFGYYGRFNGGLLSLICYALLYFAFVSNVSKRSMKYIVYSILASATLVAVYGILEHFGGSISCLLVTGQFNNDCWVQDVQNRVFATLGQPNWLSAMLVAVMPLALSNVLTQKQDRNTRILYIAISIIFFMCILFTKSRSGFIGLIIADLVFWLCLVLLTIEFKKYLNLKIIINLIKQFVSGVKKYLVSFAVVHLILIILILIFGTPWTPRFYDLIQHKEVQQSVDSSDGGTESGDIRAIVWKGAVDIWRHYPIFGTGVETFGYSYWQYRPIEHNNTSEWDFLYNKAHNEYLNTAANTGTIGLFTYLILIGTSIYTLRKSPALLAGYVSILITNFFGFSVVNISLLMFLIPAMAIALYE